MISISARFHPVAIAFLLLSTSQAAETLPELPSLPRLPSWAVTVEAGFAAGYRDNLLLSPDNLDRSGLLRTELDVFALKIPIGRLDGFAYLNASEMRFLSGEHTDSERAVILFGEARWQASRDFKASWAVQAYRQKQVFDVSVTETELTTALLEVTGFATGPGLRWTRSSFHLEAKALGRRDHYRGGIDGYDEGEGSLRAGWTRTGGAEFSAGILRRWRDHDTRTQFTSAGRPLTGTRLAMRQTEASAQWNQPLAPAKRARLELAVSRQWNRDNGSGYFDFDRDQARANLRWAPEKWQAEAGATYARYEFPVQLVGLGINPAHRRKREVHLHARLSRQVSERLALFAAAEHTRARSNDERSRFTVNTVYAGVRLTWDSLSQPPAPP